MTIKQEDSSSDKSCNSSDEVPSETDSPYPRLKLNAEEKRLLQKEGITLPSHYPLTKHEERELKRIRRKIRNKISAQDSRKRKKEYVDGLEDRVKQCTEENISLLKRIKVLQSQNQSLAGQLKRLQTLIQKGNKSAQPATCLMVLLLSLALVALPNLRSHSNNNNNDLTQKQEQSEKASLAGKFYYFFYIFPKVYHLSLLTLHFSIGNSNFVDGYINNDTYFDSITAHLGTFNSMKLKMKKYTFFKYFVLSFNIRLYALNNI